MSGDSSGVVNDPNNNEEYDEYNLDVGEVELCFRPCPATPVLP